MKYLIFLAPSFWGVLLVALKLFGVISWPWWYVLSPWWVVWGLLILLYIIVYVVPLAYYTFKRVRFIRKIQKQNADREKLRRSSWEENLRGQ